MPKNSGISNVVARNLLRAREVVREQGSDSAVEAIRAGTRPWSGEVAASCWFDGRFSARASRPGSPAEGQLFKGMFLEFVEELRGRAQEVFPKGEGFVVSYAITRTAGSTDAECESITAIFMDADGTGDWDELIKLCAALGLAHLHYRTASHTLERPSWHFVLFLAEPLIVPVGDVRRWKRERYMPEYGWVLGVLSELAGLRCEPFGASGQLQPKELGFDPATSRLLQPTFPPCRRTADAPVPEVQYAPGLALDWQALLDATGYKPEPKAGRRVPRRLAEERRSTSTEPIARIQALEQAGLIIGPIDELRLKVTCPFEGGHTPGSGDESSTIIFRDTGVFVCLHASCAGRTWDQVLAELPASARQVYERAKETAGVRRLQAQLVRNKGLADGPEVDLAEARNVLRARMRTAEGCVVFTPPPGLGKTTTAADVIAMAGRPVVYSGLSNELANSVQDLLMRRSIRVSRTMGVLNVLNDDGTPACTQYILAKEVQDAGGSVPAQLCRRCPDRDGCRARESGDTGALIEVTNHALLRAALKRAGKCRGNCIKEQRPCDCPAPVAIIDELSALTDTDELTGEDLSRLGTMLRALATSREILDGRYCYRMLPWVSILAGAAQLEASVEDTARRYAQGFGGEQIRSLLVQLAIVSNGITSDARVLANWRQVPDFTESFKDRIFKLDADTMNRFKFLQRVLNAVHRAARGDALLTVERGSVLVTTRSELADLIVQTPNVIILDAYAPLAELRRLRPDLQVVSVRARETAEVTRIIRYHADASRRKLVPGSKPAWNRVVRLVVEGMERARRAGVRRLLLVTFKQVALALSLNGTPAEAEVARWRAEGRQLAVRWFGAVRGLNDYVGFDGCLTVGDSWVHLGDHFDGCELLGVPEDEANQSLDYRSAAELAQAHSRLRDLTRQTAAWHLHIGSLAPLDFDSANAKVVRGRRGRPRKASSMLLEELAGIVEGLGSQAQAARLAGIPRRTLRGYLDGRTVVPAEAAARLREAVQSAGRRPGQRYGGEEGGDGAKFPTKKKRERKNFPIGIMRPTSQVQGAPSTVSLTWPRSGAERAVQPVGWGEAASELDQQSPEDNLLDAPEPGTFDDTYVPPEPQREYRMVEIAADGEVQATWYMLTEPAPSEYDDLDCDEGGPYFLVRPA